MDIVEKLRANYSINDSSGEAHMALEAADQIEQLRRLLMETECELNAATDGVYLPHRFRALGWLN